MKHKLKILSLVLLVLAVFGCQESAEEEYFPPQNILPTLIGHGQLSSNATIQQQNTVISNQSQWNQFIIEMNNMNGEDVSTSFTEINVDFTNYIIIALIDSMRGDTGYSIDIDSVVENQSDVTVDILHVNIHAGWTVIQRPYHIVKIPIQSKPIVFI